MDALVTVCSWNTSVVIPDSLDMCLTAGPLTAAVSLNMDDIMVWTLRKAIEH